MLTILLLTTLSYLIYGLGLFYPRDYGVTNLKTILLRPKGSKIITTLYD